MRNAGVVERWGKGQEATRSLRLTPTQPETVLKERGTQSEVIDSLERRRRVKARTKGRNRKGQQKLCANYKLVEGTMHHNMYIHTYIIFVTPDHHIITRTASDEWKGILTYVP